MEKVQVGAAVIEKSGRFLLGKRSRWKTSAPGYWSPISGRIEPGESEDAALVREVNEEVGLAVAPVRKLGECDTHDGRARIHWWLVKTISGEAYLRNDEHSDLRWFTLDELSSLSPFFSQDLEFFQAAALLINEGRNI